MKNQSLEVCTAGMVPVLRRATQGPILAQENVSARELPEMK